MEKRRLKGGDRERKIDREREGGETERQRERESEREEKQADIKREGELQPRRQLERPTDKYKDIQVERGTGRDRHPPQ